MVSLVALFASDIDQARKRSDNLNPSMEFFGGKMNVIRRTSVFVQVVAKKLETSS